MEPSQPLVYFYDGLHSSCGSWRLSVRVALLVSLVRLVRATVDFCFATMKLTQVETG